MLLSEKYPQYRAIQTTLSTLAVAAGFSAHAASTSAPTVAVARRSVGRSVSGW
jgi:hypothetical protein